MRAFALLSHQAEELHGSRARCAEPVRGAGVELGGLAGFEDEIEFAEHQSEPAVENESPVETFVRAENWCGVVARRQADTNL